MKCCMDICIALWLIAFALGIFILMKVYRDNLAWPFRVSGWLVVVVALGGMLCCSLRCMMGSCNRGPCQGPPMMVPYGGYYGKCHPGGGADPCGEEGWYRKKKCCKDREACKREEDGIELLHSDSLKGGKK